MTFFTTLDNSELAKLNFISDDAIAFSINEHAYMGNNPPVTSPSLMGGYVYPILRDLAQGATYQILKLPLPKNDPRLYNYIRWIVKQPETIYSYVDEGNITVVQIEGWDRRATPLSQFGWSVKAAPKTFKRLKTLNRPFRLWNKMSQPLRVYVVPDDSYTNEDLSEFEPDIIERVLDGAFVISRQLFLDCLDNVQFPVFANETQLGSVDYYRAEEYFRQAQFFHAFNARLLGPMEFSGELSGLQALGTLKGEAFINVSDLCERMHVDVICTESALKGEVVSTEDTWVLLEPQKAKKFAVNSDLQTMVNLPAVYQPEDVKSWIREYLQAALEQLKQDRIMESWFDMATPFFNSSNRFDQNDVTTLTKWNARAWLMSGRRITESPWLFEQLAHAIAKSIRSSDASKLRFPIPCAVRAQVISQSFASMAGWDLPVLEGSARWCEELEAVVVNDLDWIEMYRSHGGMDLDDFFVVYFRTIGNCRKLIAVRSPNDWGEYTTFDYVEGDWHPVFERHDGSFVLFPEIPADESLWPKRLSEAYRNGEVIYTGLPSEKQKPEPLEDKPYSMADVLKIAANNTGSASCVGANVNSRAIWALSARRHRPVQLTTMETCIDTGTQGGSAQDAEAVKAEAQMIINDLIADPKLMIDAYMWSTRFAPIFGIPFDRARLSASSHVSQIHKFRLEAATSFIDRAREHVEKHLKNAVDPQVHRLGLRFLRSAYQVLNTTRLAMVGMQPHGEQSLEFRDWEDIHSYALNKIEGFENPVDRHDFVMALYSVCFKVPARSSGKVSDQLVMNPHIFPYLLDAMRFYGLAYYVTVNSEGQIQRYRTDQWDVKCVDCGDTFIITDPKTLQAYHYHNQVCKSCRSTE